MMIKMTGIISGLLFSLSLLFAVHSFAGPKTDTVYLYNGDRITGEVKRMETGILVFKTDGLGTLNIEFDRIKTLYSNNNFTIKLSNGLRFFGSIDTSRKEGYVNLIVNNFRIPEPFSSIVEIFPVKKVFWQRLDGSLDIGYSYTKASSISQFNFSGNLDHRIEKALTQMKVNTILTDQKDQDRIRKQDYSISYSRFFKRRWFAGIQAGAQQNTELASNYRYLAGLGVGNDIIQNNSQNLKGTFGLLVSVERSASDSIQQSLEGLIQWGYKLFKFKNPDLDINAFYNLYPGITTPGRVRMEFEIKVKIKVFNDFYFGLSIYDNFDNKPVDEGSATNDWGISSSIGYSW